MTTAKKSAPDPPVRPGRPYDGTLRREKAAETRERILVAGSELLHRSSVRDWKKLTVRAVAERAGVNERTVYRYFGSERGLRDAVMHRNEQEAGVDLAGMELEDIATVASQIFEHVSQYPREPRPPLDPTLVAAKGRQQDALLAAIEAQSRRLARRATDRGGRHVRCALERCRLRATGRRLADRSPAGRRGDLLGHRTGRGCRSGRPGAEMTPATLSTRQPSTSEPVLSASTTLVRTDYLCRLPRIRRSKRTSTSGCRTATYPFDRCTHPLRAAARDHPEHRE